MDYFTIRRDGIPDGEELENWWGDNCIAAFRFKGAASASAARTDLTGNGYNLGRQNNPEWDAAKGYHLFLDGGTHNYLSNSDLNALDTVQTIIIRYSGLPGTSKVFLPFSQIKGTTPAYDVTKDMFVYARFCMNYVKAGAQKELRTNFPAIFRSWISNQYSPDYGKLSYRIADAKLPSSGVLGATRTNLFLNGTLMTMSSVSLENVTQIYSSGSPNVDYSYTLAGSGNGGHWVAAAAFYSEALGTARQRDVANAMLRL